MSLQTNTASLTALLESVNALPDKIDTSGTATAADIYEGKTATVNDTKLTGTNPYNAANVDPAVTSALAAIAEKGVDTTGKGLADIAGLVAAIEAGGGGGVKTAYGTYTPENDIGAGSWPKIEHGLGETPNFILFYTDNLEAITGMRYLRGAMLYFVDIEDVETYYSVACGTISASSTTISYKGSNNGGFALLNGVTTYSDRVVDAMDNETFKLGVQNGNQYLYAQSGTTYNWIVAVI